MLDVDDSILPGQGDRKSTRSRAERKFQAIQDRAEKVLGFLDAATSLRDLSLPGLKLEKLSGDREGQHSIRINRQYRVCFEWHEGNAHRAEIVDYH